MTSEAVRRFYERQGVPVPPKKKKKFHEKVFSGIGEAGRKVGGEIGRSIEEKRTERREEKEIYRAEYRKARVSGIRSDARRRAKEQFKRSKSKKAWWSF